MLNLLGCVPGGVTGLASPAICTDQSPTLAGSHGCHCELKSALSRSATEILQAIWRSPPQSWPGFVPPAGEAAKADFPQREEMLWKGRGGHVDGAHSRPSPGCSFNSSPLRGGCHVLCLSPRSYILLSKHKHPQGTDSVPTPREHSVKWGKQRGL